MLITDIALITANLIMFQKIANILSIVSFVNGSFHEWWSILRLQVCNFRTISNLRVMNEILGNVQGMMPKILEKVLPDVTGESLPIPKGLGI